MDDAIVVDDAFVRQAAAAGIDTSDPERMNDLQHRVSLMRAGLARLNEIDVAGAESPSVFVPAAPVPSTPDP